MKEADEKREPVIEFHPHKRHFFVFRMAKHAWFEVKPQPEVTEAMERLIGKHFTVSEQAALTWFSAVSYLLVERRRRDSRVRVKIEKA